MRRRPALLSALTAAALVAVALAGCAPQGRGPGNQPAGCTPEFPTGDASSTVQVSSSMVTRLPGIGSHPFHLLALGARPALADRAAPRRDMRIAIVGTDGADVFRA